MPIKLAEREYRTATNMAFADEENKLILRGSPIAFDTPTCLYECDGIKYYELIDRNALQECDMSDFIFNYNHSGRVYARTKNGSLKYKSSEGIFNVEMELDADDEGHKQLYHDIKSGLIDRMSFSFTVSEEEYDYETRTRKILKIKKLYDVSAVDLPAYNETSISARSFFEVEHDKEMKNLDEEKRKKLLIAKTFII